MTKDLLDILYNPGSVQTCVAQDRCESRVAELTEADHDLLKDFEELALADDEVDLIENLKIFADKLSSTRSGTLVTILLREFNLFLKRTASHYADDRDLYTQSFKTIMIFKACLDEISAETGCLTQSDWIELEKSLYVLAVWEEGADSSANVYEALMQ